LISPLTLQVLEACWDSTKNEDPDEKINVVAEGGFLPDLPAQLFGC